MPGNVTGHPGYVAACKKLCRVAMQASPGNRKRMVLHLVATKNDVQEAHTKVQLVPALRSLWLMTEECGVAAALFSAAPAGCFTSITSLRLTCLGRGYADADDNVLALVARACPRLENLCVGTELGVGNRGLHRLSELRELRLETSRVDWQGLAYDLRHLTKLHTVQGVLNIDQLLAGLAAQPNSSCHLAITCLSICGTIGDTQLDGLLQHFPALKYLHVYGFQLLTDHNTQKCTWEAVCVLCELDLASIARLPQPAHQAMHMLFYQGRLTLPSTDSVEHNVQCTKRAVQQIKKLSTVAPGHLPILVYDTETDIRVVEAALPLLAGVPGLRLEGWHVTTTLLKAVGQHVSGRLVFDSCTFDPDACHSMVALLPGVQQLVFCSHEEDAEWDISYALPIMSGVVSGATRTVRVLTSGGMSHALQQCVLCMGKDHLVTVEVYEF